jgi:hypothetical protein
MLVDPGPRRDRLRRKADDLPELPNRLAFRNGHDRHLVTARHAFAGRHARGLRALRDLVHRNDQIVVGREAYDAGRCHICTFFIDRGILERPGSIPEKS